MATALYLKIHTTTTNTLVEFGRPKLKIQSKLFMFALLCSVLPLLAVFGISLYAANDSLSTTVKETLQARAIEKLSDLQHDLADAKHELTTLSMLMNMQNVKPEGNSPGLQQDINRFAMRNPIFAEIIAVNMDGQIIASSSNDFVDINLRRTWEFEAPRLGIHFDGPVGNSHRLSRTVATHSVPLYNDQSPYEIIGTLIGSIDWVYLQQSIADRKIFGEEQSEHRLMFLESTNNNRILYGTEGFDAPTDLFKSDSENGQVKQVNVNELDYLMVSIKSKPVSDFRDPNWRLHILIDRNIALASADSLQTNIILAGAPVMLLVLALSYLFSSSIVTPVNELLRGAEKLSAGDYDYELVARNDADQIGQLTTQFNSMRIAIRENEQELVKKTCAAEQAAKLKGEFLANMSHEVRTPINGVLGMTELLLNTPLDSKQNRYAETISRSGHALLSVINDILDFSKIEAGKLDLTNGAFDLRELAEDVVEMLVESAHRKGVEVVLRMPPEHHVAFNGDSNRLRQILTNLVGNAVKFTHEGEVEVRVSQVDGDDGETMVRFDVIDTGIGIPESHHQSIFESFVQADGTTTRQYGGTGLGLSISANLARLMGGEIGMNSTPGDGSTFWFTASLSKLSNNVQEVWRSTDALAGKHVLVVDDNNTNREILTAQIEFWGATAVAVSSAAKAIQALENTLASGETFDAAILDMQMPIMNGLQLATFINQQNFGQDMCVALLSSSCDNLNMAECHRVGIQTLSIKPVRQHDLYNALTAVMIDDQPTNVNQKIVAKKISGNLLRGNVLLAEDNVVNQDMMLEMLRQVGVTVELAINGKEAFEAIKNQPFDVVLMDCQMPIMDGFEATAAIRQEEKDNGGFTHTPIIALTANAMASDRLMCLESGMDEYLSKPVTFQQLRTKLAPWLKEDTTDNKTKAATNPGSTQSLSDAGDLSFSDSPQIQQVAAKLTATPDLLPTNQDNNSNSPVLDQNIFNEVCSMCEQAPDGFFEKLLDKYIQSSKADLQILSEALQAKDGALTGSTAHRLKSSSGNWGGKRLADACHSLELAGKSNNITGATTILKQIEVEHWQLISALQNKDSKAA